ncbi:hypothetical protein TSUD_225090 [Trifolium subterraneum]|uniref:Uncharacterized protein n=1 Tax=Trifolium subterraneum TaxID=3900 RepID=A0A2Z6N9Y4_TRISU|nr:hypothetical protein TSUD_225090 [Trifolium subterraneum]
MIVDLVVVTCEDLDLGGVYSLFRGGVRESRLRKLPPVDSLFRSKALWGFQAVALEHIVRGVILVRCGGDSPVSAIMVLHLHAYTRVLIIIEDVAVAQCILGL